MKDDLYWRRDLFYGGWKAVFWWLEWKGQGLRDQEVTLDPIKDVPWLFPFHWCGGN